MQAFKAKNIQLEEGEEELMEQIESSINDTLQKMQEGLLTKEDADEAIKLALAEASKSAKISTRSIVVTGSAKKNDEGEAEGDDLTLDEFLRERSKEIAELRKAQAQEAAQPRTYAEAVREACKELADKVKKHKKTTGDSQVPFSLDQAIKAPALMTTANTVSNAQTVPPIMYLGEGLPNPDPRLGLSVTSLVDTGNTSLPAIPYADKLPTQGTMTIVPEGTLKPLLSFAIERRFSTAFKIAGRMKITEEALDDVPGMEASINGELRYAHDQAVEDAIYDHVTAFAPAFVAGGMAASTNAPSNYDVIRAASFGIKIASKGRFMPNAAVVNSADVYAMGATKDNTYNYVLPPFVLPDGTRVAGVAIIETQDDAHVPPGSFIIGDWRKVKRRVYKGFSLRMGQFGLVTEGTTSITNVMSDFECNLYTFIGESRMHLYHYKNDETAFIKDTFANVKTLIAMP